MTLVAGPILEDSLRCTKRNRSGFDFDFKIFTGPIPNSIQRNFTALADDLRSEAVPSVPFSRVELESDLSPLTSPLPFLSGTLLFTVEMAAWNWVDDWIEGFALFLFESLSPLLPTESLIFPPSSSTHSCDLHRTVCMASSSSSPVFKSTLSGSFVVSVVPTVFVEAEAFLVSDSFDSEKVMPEPSEFPNRLLVVDDDDANANSDVPVLPDDPNPEDFPLEPTPAKPSPPPKPDDPLPVAPNPDADPNPKTFFGDFTNSVAFSVDEARIVEANGLLELLPVFVVDSLSVEESGVGASPVPFCASALVGFGVSDDLLTL
mmetsp:Transcript_18337/g.42259  ORF Transcript_18337/g.42259 Transcript_18337/m.42259 type:complete len:318 (+) Transcript_18337:2582-3535(+)